jgi:hypothetical protein
VTLTLTEPPRAVTHTGRRRLSLRPAGSASVRCTATGAATACDRTKYGNSSCPTIRSSPPSCVTSSASIVDPQEHAVVLPVDEKSQIQALDRTQQGLPLKKAQCGTMTHDYKRVAPPPSSPPSTCSKATSLAGVCSATPARSSSDSCNVVENQVPVNKQVHVVLDNYATHKPRRLPLHCCPTSPPSTAPLKTPTRTQSHFQWTKSSPPSGPGNKR